MVEKTFEFGEPTLIQLTGETATGTKKVVEKRVVEMTARKRDSGAGFSWEKTDGSGDSISFRSHDIDILPPEVGDWFDSA